MSAVYDTADPQNPFPQLQQAIAFTVKLVDRLVATAPKNGPLLPARATINANYPARPNGKVAMTNVGRAQIADSQYVPAPDQCDTCFRVDFGSSPDQSEPVGNADWTAVNAGSVSLSLLDGDWTAPGWALGQVVSIVDNLSLRLRLKGLTA